MRSVILAGVAAVALTLAGCGMFGGKSSNSTSANDQPSTTSTSGTYAGTSSNGAANSATAPLPSTREQSGTSAANNSSRRSTGSADVREAQQQLQSAGFYKGKIDGIAGQETKQAVMRFQKKNGLPQTGTLDQATMAQLERGSSSSGSSTPGTSAPSKGSNSSGSTIPKQQ